jgi:hypothetical protein
LAIFAVVIKVNVVLLALLELLTALDQGMHDVAQLIDKTAAVCELSFD